MRRADRLFQIVQYLHGGRLVTAEVLAARLEVSRRTIYRDVADLIGSGVPIEGEAGVGYVMRSDFHMPPLMFTEDEIVALVAGARLIRAWGGTSMAGAAEEALVKIQAVLPERARRRSDAVMVEAPRTEDGPTEATRALLDRSELAANGRIRLCLDYADADGRESARVVRPLGLWFWGKVRTLVAWCEMRRDFRMFRVDRIHAAEELDRFPPERDKNLAAFFSSCAYQR